MPAAWRGCRVYLQLYSGNAAAGPNSFVGEVLSKLGFVNVLPEHVGIYPKNELRVCGVCQSRFVHHGTTVLCRG